MLKFEAKDGAPYKYDYPAIFASIRDGKKPALDTYRQLCKDDLFFLLYFGLEREDVNHPWIVARIREAEEDPTDTLDLWAREHYKLLQQSQPVITPSGWTTHGDLHPGDLVFSPSGEPVMVLAETRVFNDADCYRITFSDGEEIVAGGDHLWDVNYFNRQRVPGTKNERKGWEVRRLDTRQILAYVTHQQELRNPGYLSIDYTQPLVLPKKDLPIPPYVLGLWLGDGATAAGQISNRFDQVWETIAAQGYEVGPDTSTPGKNTQQRTVHGLRRQLGELGVLGDKHIPPDYLRASLAQRTALLQGLMDTDGNVSERGDLIYVTTRKRLAEDVAELIRTLGMRANVRPYEYFMNNMDRNYVYWQVAFRVRPEIKPFRLQYHIDRLKPHRTKEWAGRKYIHNVEPIDSVPSKCIQVAGGRYLAGRFLTATYNSTIRTFGEPIQDLLRNPEERIAIFSHTRPIAKGFLRQIKQTLESRVQVKRWFPDVFFATPQKQAPKWSEDDGILVKRKGTPKEASIEAWGLVDGQPISKHFTKRIYDDVVTKESVTTPEQIKKTLDAYELSHSLGTDGGKKRVVGTHYHYADLYMHLRKAAAYKVRIHPATKDGTATGEPVFLSRERLEELRKEQGPYVFSCQQLLKPIADENQTFKAEWIHRFSRPPRLLNKYLLVDPANEKKKDSDYTVIAVVGLDQEENYFLLDMIRDRLNLTERWEALKETWKKWKPLRVGYEQYGMQADIAYMEERQRKERIFFPITPLGGRTSKLDRIRRLVPLFETGRFWLPEVLTYKGENMVLEFIDDEFLPFPFCAHDDMLDCIARITDEKMGVVAPMPAGYDSGEAETDYDVLRY